MAKQRVVVVNREPVTATYIDGVPTIPVDAVSWERRVEWVPEEPTYEWTPWEYEVEDTGLVTYDAVSNNDGSLFRAPTLRALNPRRQTRIIETRRLVKRWVDREQGPMHQVVDKEVHVRVR